MELPNRIDPRLKCYDYSTCGAYFVTICTHSRKETLSVIRRGDPCGRPEVCLSRLGRIGAEMLRVLENKYGVSVDTWVIMPDHIHLVLILPDGGKPLGRIIGAYKSMVAHEWLTVCKSEGRIMGDIWQRNYYEHVIRNEEDLTEIRRYIAGNPGRWLDKRKMPDT